MNEEYVDITTPDGCTLKAIYCRTEKPKKIVIMCHGISSHKQEYLDMFPNLADHLATNGISSIRFDYRGHGESDGKQEDFSVITQIIDISAVIEWINTQVELKQIPAAYVGVSFGGGAGLYHQFIYNKFEKISLFAPVISYQKTFINPSTPWGIKNFNNIRWADGLKKGFLLMDGEFKIGVRLMTELAAMEPVRLLNKIDVPIQIIHGSEDTLVPCEVPISLEGKMDNVEIIIVDKMGHGLYVDGDDDGKSSGSIDIQKDYYTRTLKFISR